MTTHQQCCAWLRAVMPRRPWLSTPAAGKALALAAALTFAGLAGWVSPLAAYTVYVTNEKDNTVSIIDSSKLEVIKTIKVGQRPRGITLSKDQKWLFICTSDDNTVQVWDTETLAFVKTLPSGPDPELFILHPAGNPLYVANEDDNLITVVDVGENRVVAEIAVGVEPEGLGISPDGSL
jgi:YVTN family beta-propeller protein